MSDASREALERLEALVAADPGAPGFAALAEARRRAGEPAEAERVARAGLERKPGSPEGAIALALALLDQARPDESRAALARVADELHAGAGGAPAAAPDSDWPAAAAAPGLGGELGEEEIDVAFAQAETDRERVIDADRIARDAIADADRELAQELRERPSFATHTFATLLERQGDADTASRLRASLGGEPRSQRERVIATLEGWLENLKRRAR